MIDHCVSDACMLAVYQLTCFLIHNARVASSYFLEAAPVVVVAVISGKHFILSDAHKGPHNATVVVPSSVLFSTVNIHMVGTRILTGHEAAN